MWKEKLVDSKWYELHDIENTIFKRMKLILWLLYYRMKELYLLKDKWSAKFKTLIHIITEASALFIFDDLHQA